MNDKPRHIIIKVLVWLYILWIISLFFPLLKQLGKLGCGVVMLVLLALALSALRNFAAAIGPKTGS